MTTLGIICEYNPFHTGHAYHIEAARRACNADTVIGIMSGYFVQRGEPAILPPKIRAQAALLNGMDCVIALPTVYSCVAGNLFADGALQILSRIPSLRYLAMGVEDSGEILQTLSHIQLQNPPTYAKKLREGLDAGLSYAIATANATALAAQDFIAPAVCAEILHRPNNILAIEYLKAIELHALPIEPIFIVRRGNGYNDTATSGDYISATAARALLCEKRYEDLRPYIPQNCFELFSDAYRHFPIRQEAYNALMVHALRTRDVGQAYDTAEGIDVRLKKFARRYASLDTILSECKNKRYTMSRLKRICLQTLLGITKEKITAAQGAYGKVIGIRKSRKDLLKSLPGIAIRNIDFHATPQTTAIAEIDNLAGSIYALITGRDGNDFSDSKLSVI